MIKYVVLLMFSTTLFAGGSHHEPATNTTTTTNITNTSGTALAIATAQHNFDFGTHSWQGSIGVGSFDSESAISFGVAKRLDRVLVNGSFAREDNKTGVGVGVNWRF